MNVRTLDESLMSRLARISILASVAVHLLAFLIFSGVKLQEYRVVEDRVPVTFLKNRETKPIHRSLPVRAMTSLDNKPVQNQLMKQYTVRPEYRSSGEFYVSAPEKVFSSIRSIGQEAFQDAGLQRPTAKMKERASSIAAVDPRETQIREPQASPRITGGHELLKGFVPAQAKPELMTARDALRRFAEAVRKKIESKKKYPMAAQSAGIEGRAEVRLTILKDGTLEKAEVAKTSGYEILDDAALQSVLDAAPFPPIAEEMGRDSIEMSIYLVFKIGPESR